MMRGWVAGPYRQLTQLKPSLLERIRIAQQASYLLRRAAIGAAGGEPQEEELAGPAGGRLAEIDVPTLVLIGDRDHPDAAAIAERLAGGIRGARKQLIEGVGHMITMERPEDFLRIAREFLLAAASR
jgi:pimeloyl-ACP methyl ester carboxylesterase